MIRSMLLAVVLVLAAGCAPAPGGPSATPTTAYVQHMQPDQVDPWRGLHYEALVLDVRSIAEWDDDLSHLDNATQVPLEELEARLAEFDAYREKPVLVYDRTGVNATRAGQILVTHGFRDVSVIEGGLKAYRDWQKSR